ncbi:hypothetical protein CBR_g36328 [Chara braunii]|uniref:Uncharacterized protein n=1 Tax=Chara braunii TaxID=69332 RepID=A0A388LKJ3_CHABU|nr:hypothetical protein CBR_g36328 [Chara braunii]|eukprot:GBG82797.1 hypothetical protein CBR_g36328 [Chara braunii]
MTSVGQCKPQMGGNGRSREADPSKVRRDGRLDSFYETIDAPKWVDLSSCEEEAEDVETWWDSHEKSARVENANEDDDDTAGEGVKKLSYGVYDIQLVEKATITASSVSGKSTTAGQKDGHVVKHGTAVASLVSTSSSSSRTSATSSSCRTPFSPSTANTRLSYNPPPPPPKSPAERVASPSIKSSICKPLFTSQTSHQQSPKPSVSCMSSSPLPSTSSSALQLSQKSVGGMLSIVGASVGSNVAGTAVRKESRPVGGAMSRLGGSPSAAATGTAPNASSFAPPAASERGRPAASAAIAAASAAASAQSPAEAGQTGASPGVHRLPVCGSKPPTPPSMGTMAGESAGATGSGAQVAPVAPALPASSPGRSTEIGRGSGAQAATVAPALPASSPGQRMIGNARQNSPSTAVTAGLATSQTPAASPTAQGRSGSTAARPASAAVQSSCSTSSSPLSSPLLCPSLPLSFSVMLNPLFDSLVDGLDPSGRPSSTPLRPPPVPMNTAFDERGGRQLQPSPVILPHHQANAMRASPSSSQPPSQKEVLSTSPTVVRLDSGAAVSSGTRSPGSSPFSSARVVPSRALESSSVVSLTSLQDVVNKSPPLLIPKPTSLLPASPCSSLASSLEGADITVNQASSTALDFEAGQATSASAASLGDDEGREGRFLASRCPPAAANRTEATTGTAGQSLAAHSLAAAASEKLLLSVASSVSDPRTDAAYAGVPANAAKALSPLLSAAKTVANGAGASPLSGPERTAALARAAATAAPALATAIIASASRASLQSSPAAAAAAAPAATALPAGLDVAVRNDRPVLVTPPSEFPHVHTPSTSPPPSATASARHSLCQTNLPCTTSNAPPPAKSLAGRDGLHHLHGVHCSRQLAGTPSAVTVLGGRTMPSQLSPPGLAPVMEALASMTMSPSSSGGNSSGSSPETVKRQRISITMPPSRGAKRCLGQSFCALPTAPANCSTAVTSSAHAFPAFHHGPGAVASTVGYPMYMGVPHPPPNAQQYLASSVEGTAIATTMGSFTCNPSTTAVSAACVPSGGGGPFAAGPPPSQLPLLPGGGGGHVVATSSSDSSAPGGAGTAIHHHLPPFFKNSPFDLNLPCWWGPSSTTSRSMAGHLSSGSTLEASTVVENAAYLNAAHSDLNTIVKSVDGSHGPPFPAWLSGTSAGLSQQQQQQQQQQSIACASPHRLRASENADVCASLGKSGTTSPSGKSSFGGGKCNCHHHANSLSASPSSLSRSLCLSTVRSPGSEGVMRKRWGAVGTAISGRGGGLNPSSSSTRVAGKMPENCGQCENCSASQSRCVVARIPCSSRSLIPGRERVGGGGVAGGRSSSSGGSSRLNMRTSSSGGNIRSSANNGRCAVHDSCSDALFRSGDGVGSINTSNCSSRLNNLRRNAGSGNKSGGVKNECGCGRCRRERTATTTVWSSTMRSTTTWGSSPTGRLSNQTSSSVCAAASRSCRHIRHVASGATQNGMEAMMMSSGSSARQSCRLSRHQHTAVSPRSYHRRKSIVPISQTAVRQMVVRAQESGSKMIVPIAAKNRGGGGGGGGGVCNALAEKRGNHVLVDRAAQPEAAGEKVVVAYVNINLKGIAGSGGRRKKGGLRLRLGTSLLQQGLATRFSRRKSMLLLRRRKKREEGMVATGSRSSSTEGKDEESIEVEEERATDDDECEREDQPAAAMKDNYTRLDRLAQIDPEAAALLRGVLQSSLGRDVRLA